MACAALCWAVAAGAAEPKARVVASFFPLYCWTANVAGEHARVDSLLAAGAEPHDYAFKVSDARRLAGADLVVVNGLGLEPWLPRFLRTSKSSAHRIVTVTDGLGEQLIFGEHHHHHHHGHAEEPDHAGETPNEHVWLDPLLAAHGVTNILLALQRLDAANASAYARNARAYVERLHQLDAEIRQRLDDITNRAIVTYHDAFPYFARRYGFEIVGVVEKVPGVNPTPKYLARLRRIMRERQIGVIFVGRGSATRVARRIATDLNARLVELDTLESGPPAPAAYEERMRYNAIVLQQYLR